jgi:prefoldin subunit 5
MTAHDDPYVAQLKARKRELQLELKAINTEMANIRANYSQKLGTANFFWPASYSRLRSRKDKQLQQMQPQKEQLQAEIQAIQEQMNSFRA